MTIFRSDFGRRREEMNSKTAKVEFSNSKEGLDGEKVYEQANAASGLGNSEVNFKGYDEQGDTIRGSNEDFSLTVELDELSKNAERAAREKYAQFQHLVTENVIKLPNLANDVIVKVIKIFSGIK